VSRFVITGFPRSGHAWLANYLYKGQSVVAHEGARFYWQAGASYRQAHVHALQELTGDCASTWMLYPELLATVPRVVLIDRPQEVSMRRWDRATEGLSLNGDKLYALLAEGYQKTLAQQPLVIPYEESYSVGTVERICRYIREDCDLRRLSLLRNTRVTQDVPREYQRVMSG
tara:strand:- start:212 stop:727 length:516 start_codon:yes stop_codon:yes gene_type:complete